LQDLKLDHNAEVLLHVNGFGATPLMELYLLFNSAAKELEKNKVKISRSIVGNFTTSLDMTGASITLCKLDDQLLKHWDSPVHTAALRWGM
jgi:dihydroxyacetone kinase-like protein